MAVRAKEEGVGKRILVIDDEEMILDAIKIIFEDLGHTVEVRANSQAGLEEGLRADYDLVLVDIRMPGKNGAEITEELLKTKPGTRILLITAYSNDPLVARALNAGAHALLKKPFEIAKVLDFLEK
jgi:CheY-like chemotaxis protein